MRKKIKNSTAKYKFNKDDFSQEEIFTLKAMYKGLFAQKMLDYIGESAIESILGDSIDTAAE